MIRKQVQVVGVKTMADQTIRITIDLLSGNSDDIAKVYRLMARETTMILSSTEELVETITQIALELQS